MLFNPTIEAAALRFPTGKLFLLCFKLTFSYAPKF